MYKYIIFWLKHVEAIPGPGDRGVPTSWKVSTSELNQNRFTKINGYILRDKAEDQKKNLTNPKNTVAIAI